MIAIDFDNKFSERCLQNSFKIQIQLFFSFNHGNDEDDDDNAADAADGGGAGAADDDDGDDEDDDDDDFDHEDDNDVLPTYATVQLESVAWNNPLMFRPLCSY